jgi:hypothetical protein
MTRRRWVAAALGLLLSAIVTLVWVFPTVYGSTVDCGDVDPAACDRIWRAAAAEIGGVQVILPVTSAKVSGAETCPQVYLEWLGGVFAVYRESFC